MKQIKSLLAFLFLIPIINACTTGTTTTLQDPPDGFYAYHTDLAMTGEAFNKYKDLVVVLGKGQRMEFSRENAYRPRWVTPSGTHLVDELFSDKDKDEYLDYTYVRLIKSGPEKIVVHWRYIPDIEKINQANDALDPLNPHGFLGAVHEVFMIHPDGTVNREVKNAKGTRAEDWNNPAITTRQEIKLTENGIEHGEVIWGETGPFLPREAVAGNPVKSLSDINDLLLSWSFDEGLEPHADLVTDPVFRIEAGFCYLILYQLNSDHQSALAHVANMGKLF